MKEDLESLYMALSQPETKVFEARIGGCHKPMGEDDKIRREYIQGFIFTNNGDGLWPDETINMTDCTIIIIPKGNMQELIKKATPITSIVHALGNKEEWRDKP